MDTTGSGASRAGGDGIHNEDAFLVEEGLGLYVVCDGASRAPGGELASHIATGAIEAFVEQADGDLDWRAREEHTARTLVDRAMSCAMEALAEAERNDAALRGLATTVTLLLAHGDLGVIGHRGDSRAYLIRRDRAHQLTIDHQLTAGDAGAGLGYEVFSVDFEPGDTVVLCTDGAEHVVAEDDIVRVAGDLSPRILASRIVSAANHQDPDSDATAVVVRVRKDAEPGWLELSAPARGTMFGHTLEPAAAGR